MGLKNLSDEKLFEGMKKCFENGESLLEDAYILSKENKYARAYTLCQLAIEEFAKPPILFSLLMERSKQEQIYYKNYNRIFTDHKEKSEFSIQWEIAMFKYFKQQTGVDFADKLIKNSEEYLTKLKELNDLKNESLYVSIKNNDFQSPSEIIDKEKFESIFGIASFRKLSLQVFGKFNEKNIDEFKKSLRDDDEGFN